MFTLNQHIIGSPQTPPDSGATRLRKGGILLKARFLTALFPLIFFMTPFLGSVRAQQGDIDTLYYFDPDTLEMGTIWTGDIVDAAIYFAPDSLWEAYDIVELDLLFPPDAWDIYDSLSFHKGETAHQPGEKILSVAVAVVGPGEKYPHWKKVDLSEFDEVKDLQGNFWLGGTDAFLLSCVGSVTSSGNSFVYSANTSSWSGSLYDFAVRAIVERQRVGTSDQPGRDHAERRDPLRVRNYPNPSRGSTVIDLEIQGAATPSSIDIYNLRGEAVTALYKGILGPGKHRFEWNGKSRDGREAPAGVYFCHVLREDRSFAIKIVLLR